MVRAAIITAIMPRAVSQRIAGNGRIQANFGDQVVRLPRHPAMPTTSRHHGRT